MSLRTIFSSGKKQSAIDALYATIVEQARQPVFYLEGAVTDSVDGRFDLLCLHMFLVLHRLGEIGRPARSLAQGLFDLMFVDMDQNLREMGVSDLAVGGKVKAMAKALYGRIDAYEPALADGDAMKEALHRNLYRGMSVSQEALARMAAYIKANVAELERQTLDTLGEGRVRFAALDV